MNNAPPRISLALIARNEESVIARCLESAKPIAEELIVVDTGSTDSTRKIAHEIGAKVLEFPWQSDFSAARNASIEASTGSWILVLDADEYLPDTSALAIRQLITEEGGKPRAFHLLNKSSSDGGVTGMVGKIVRLFPNRPDVRYEWPVHEQVVTSLQRANIPIINTDIEIIHTGYSNAVVNRQKQSRNLQILNVFIAKNPSVPPMAFFLQGGALLDLERPEEALESYRRCQSMVPPGDPLHEGIMVRIATCLADLHRFDEILSLNPLNKPPMLHPEFLVLRAHAELECGNPKAAVELLLPVFDSPDVASIPAYDPIRIRGRSIMLLAEIFKRSSPEASIALLRLAKQSLATGHKIKLAEVLAIPF